MNFLPRPKQIVSQSGYFNITHNTVIVLDEYFVGKNTFPAKRLIQAIYEKIGLEVTFSAGSSRDGDIFITIDKNKCAQSYCLDIMQNKIVITSSDIAGALYGVQTLCQIIAQEGAILSCVKIIDEPSIATRGYFLDQTRGRVSTLEALFKIVDKMSEYKLNQFQLNIEHTFMFRDFSEMWRDDTPISANEIILLDEYCKEREIELVPCIASFGHLYKLLSTKTYSHFCELENSDKESFSFWERMKHHTVNVSDDAVLPFIKNMISEFMPLFSSNKFNICADETFDLGKGKSKNLANEKGVHTIYIEYIKELCNFIVSKGKIPLFWGDIICRTPELIKELPKETICLNWGYAPDQRENETKELAEAGAIQYLCPGVCGWNQWMPLIENSFKNISLMCSYAKKYNGIGILNTDWGDFGHINQIIFSRIGMIYGASLSWNNQSEDFENINKMISVLEYGDNSKIIVSEFAKINKYSLFSWHDTVMYYESKHFGKHIADDFEPFKNISSQSITQAKDALYDIYRTISSCIVNRKHICDNLLQFVSVTIEAINIWNCVALSIVQNEKSFSLAYSLEKWFMSFKDLWRSDCKEGDLAHISEIVFWYADMLRS